MNSDGIPAEPQTPAARAGQAIATADDPPYPGQGWWLAGLLAASLLLRLWLLLASRHYLMSDEAVTAVEALDILAGAPIPIFHYGQAYGGGHTVEALLALPWFKLFGPSATLFKLGPLLLACLHILLLYCTLYTFVSRRLALIAAALFAGFATFIGFNFLNNGGMITLLAGWLGLHLFFHAYFAARERFAMLFAAGVALGFSYYSFDYGLYYLLCVLMLWLLKEGLGLWRRWRSLTALGGGFILGAAPLIYFNLTHDFENLKLLLGVTTGALPKPTGSAPFRFLALLYHDLPAIFSTTIFNFSPTIAPLSYLTYAIFLAALLYLLIKTAPSLAAILRAGASGARLELPPAQRIVYFPLLMFLYWLIYSLSSSGGTAARYLIPLCPLIPIILAWPVVQLTGRSKIPILALLIFLGAQGYFLGQFSRDKTTAEWNITCQGEDIETLSGYLLANNLTTIVTPYEIKWRLMFASRRRIIAASYLFGYDREEKDNREVVTRVNQRGFPLVMVFDREYRFDKIARNFNPEGAFDLENFLQYLRQEKISYRTENVGRDFVVYRDFSRPIPLPDYR